MFEGEKRVECHTSRAGQWQWLQETAAAGASQYHIEVAVSTSDVKAAV